MWGWLLGPTRRPNLSRDFHIGDHLGPERRHCEKQGALPPGTTSSEASTGSTERRIRGDLRLRHARSEPGRSPLRRGLCSIIAGTNFNSGDDYCTVHEICINTPPIIGVNALLTPFPDPNGAPPLDCRLMNTNPKLVFGKQKSTSGHTRKCGRNSHMNAKSHMIQYIDMFTVCL